MSAFDQGVCSDALCALWLIGRIHERIPRVSATTARPHHRRTTLIADGYPAYRPALKRRQALQMPPPLRVLDCGCFPRPLAA
jgi:hypothetical protein